MMCRLADGLCEARPRSRDGEHWVRRHRHSTHLYALTSAPPVSLVLEFPKDRALFRNEVVSTPGGVRVVDERGQEVARGLDLPGALSRLLMLGIRVYAPATIEEASRP
jgi:hypothetical protein